MYIEVITPEASLYEGSVEMATFPGSDGSFQILQNHAPIVSSLGNGTMVVKTTKGEKKFEVEGGVVEVLNNKVIVLLEKARTI